MDRTSSRVEGRGRGVTLADVARFAAVSPATASRALRGDPRISERTRDLVQRTAAELGYVPDLRARALRRGSTEVIGLLVPTVTDPMHAQIMTGIHQEVADTEFNVLFATSLGRPELEAQALQVFARHRTAGIILVSNVLRPAEAMDLAGTDRVVFVLPDHISLAGYQQDPEVGVIRADDPSGVIAEVHHLIDQGAERLAFVSGQLLASHVTRRTAAEGAVAESHLRHPLTIYPSLGAGFDVPPRILGRIARDRPDGLICYDDFTALRLIHALKERGLRVPEDIAVCGFDDVPFARMAAPPLTTVRQPTEEMGREAVRMLLTCLETGSMPPSRVHPVRFIPRASTRRSTG
ncbi:MAG TPA: LacI family DNA-binding transcriptional regulator [Actinomycetota bacterium]|nr:LacI family DNA-binding transcriptional regulator [Actinomycetota bacterium]